MKAKLVQQITWICYYYAIMTNKLQLGVVEKLRNSANIRQMADNKRKKKQFYKTGKFRHNLLNWKKLRSQWSRQIRNSTDYGTREVQDTNILQTRKPDAIY